MAYDILIQGGAILAGTADQPPQLGDVGIKDGRIADVGNLGNARGATVIDATGKYVAPGFIDVTNHADTHLTLFKYPGLESLLMQGVTTVIGGNCGASLAPLGSHDAIEAIKKWADPRDININWSSVDEYLNEIAQLRLGVNYGTTIGFGTLRRGVIGKRVATLTREDIEKVKLLLRDGVEQGAFGFSIGLAYGHERAAATEELIDIAKALDGRGVVKMHLRSEGSDLLGAVNEAVAIGRGSNAAIEISHFKGIGKKAWRAFHQALELVENAASSGLNISFDVSPYPTTGSLLYLLVPPWARQGGLADLFRRLEDPAERKKILLFLQPLTLHYEKILVTSAKVPSIVGRTVAEIAKEANISNEEALLETIHANEGRVRIVGRAVSVKNVAEAARHPRAIIATDGEGYHQDAMKSENLVHPRSFGAFPHFWHRFVTDLRVLTPEQAIAKMTSFPAKKFGIPDRGVLAKGNVADIVVFDPKLFRDRATYRNPYRYPAGIGWVLVNGKVAVENGSPNGARNGVVLRRGQ